MIPRPLTHIDGRPANPCQATDIRYGRNQLCADALVTASDMHGQRWIVMVERTDGHGWALPCGVCGPSEAPDDTVTRKLAEATGLLVDFAGWRQDPPRYLPDPRGSDEAWMVTVLVRNYVGGFGRQQDFPPLMAADDSRRAAWVPASSYRVLAEHLAATYGGTVFPGHRPLLRQALASCCICDPEGCAADGTGAHCIDRPCGACLHGRPAPTLAEETR